jgi:hypothetical protein
VRLYRDGRQISNRHKRCIREEDYRSNKQIIAKVITVTSILVFYIDKLSSPFYYWINRPVSFTIRAIKEDPLSTVMLLFAR